MVRFSDNNNGNINFNHKQTVEQFIDVYFIVVHKKMLSICVLQVHNLQCQVGNNGIQHLNIFAMSRVKARIRNKTIETSIKFWNISHAQLYLINSTIARCVTATDLDKIEKDTLNYLHLN